jgi:hypothetical protein
MFPVSGNWETRVSGITVVKKNWADAIDASFNGLYGGTKSLVSMLLDGAGYQASSVAAGGLALGITEADDVPNIGINTSVATRLLVL